MTNKITRSLAPALVMAVLGAATGEARSPDELDAARSLPPHQLAAVRAPGVCEAGCPTVAPALPRWEPPERATS